MSTKTNNYNLIKPGEDEFIDIKDINKNMDTIDAKMKDVENKVGAPMIATTAAEMTNKERPYVYVGSQSGYTKGNWYYWNGSSWASGGVYNSVAVETDKTLTVEGKAADSAIVGQQIGELEESLGDVIKNSDAYIVNDSGSINGAKTYSATLATGEKYLIMYESNSNLPHTIFVDGKDIESANTRNCIIEYIPETDKKSIGFWIANDKYADFTFKVLHIVNGGTVIDLTNHFTQKLKSAVEINYILKAQGLLISSTPDGILTELVTTKTTDYPHPFSTFTQTNVNTDVLFKINDESGIAPFLIEDNEDTLKK